MKNILNSFYHHSIGNFSFKKFILFLCVVATVASFTWLFWPKGFEEITTVNQYEKAGEVVQASLTELASLPVTEDGDAYIIKDSLSSGLDIQYGGVQEGERDNTEENFEIHFPKRYQDEPVEVRLDEERVIRIHDTATENKDYKESLFARTQIHGDKELKNSFSKWEVLFGRKKKQSPDYISYQSSDGRKMLYYAYAHDKATGEKMLKHWTIYTKEHKSGKERESYRFENAKLRLTESGQIAVSYYGEKEQQNQQVMADVDQSLLERAQRTLEKETGQGLEENLIPDFVIPEAYYIDKEGNQHDVKWQISEDGQEIFAEFMPAKTEYPLAFDPTLSFTAPGQSTTGAVIDGDGGTTDSFGGSLAVGDFNADGKTDLAVGAPGFSSAHGNVYIFYNDGSLSSSAGSADVIITGEASSYFGTSLTSGDFNADGRTDLVVGDRAHTSGAGRVYIFYNDNGSFQNDATKANVVISGEASSWFGWSLASGDFNADGRTDLVVGANSYSTNTGRAYIFYNDGSMPTTAGSADIMITGEASSQFGRSFATGDFNTDGKIDLVVGAQTYSTNTGRAYIFYNDGSMPTTAGGADVTITGEASSAFGWAMNTGDFNADGKTDLAVGAVYYSTNTGRAYIFYNDGSMPTTAGSADVTITGETNSNFFGANLQSGDFNTDGRTDLVVGAYQYSSSTGRAYIFYNDGSIPTTAATADVIITGEASSSYFAGKIAIGDINSDGREDIIIGAEGYSSSVGRAYIFYSQNGQLNTNRGITGGATSNQFGYSFTTGDFNADGRTDLVVGAPGYSSSTGRVYIFYNDGSYPSAVANADITITGGATSNQFGNALATGDFNADGKIDLAVGAQQYSSSTGRAYIFYNDGSIPTTAGSADETITGGGSANSFGWALTAGDFNADGKTDLAASAYQASTGAGRVYIFYNDGSYPSSVSSADVTIAGQQTTVNFFGWTLTSGDFNADGKTDLAVGGYRYTASPLTDAGRAYIFYNDGSIPTTAATADVIITGETTSYFGTSLTAGDFNADGRIDLAVGAHRYSSNAGRVYIFYNDGSIPTTAATADVIIDGESSSYFGWSLTTGDFNADGKTDLVVGAYLYSSSIGRAYIFYNDGSIPTTAGTADVTITGEATSQFGYAIASGDFNADGKADLVVGANTLTSSTGRMYFYEAQGSYVWQLQNQTPTIGSRVNPNIFGEEFRINGKQNGFGAALVAGDFNADGRTDLAVSTNQGSPSYIYIFYNDGSYTENASHADVVIEGGNIFFIGASLTANDFNADGRTDLAVGAYINAGVGRAYIFYNDGSYPQWMNDADVLIDGEATSSQFGYAIASGDFNADGKADLVVGSNGYSSYMGRAYIFYNDGSYPSVAASADVIIDGAGASHNFGASLVAGDFNSDSKTDLAVGAFGSSGGRIHIFYNDGSYPGTAGSADVTITGETLSSFGRNITVGDFNADGRTDLVVAGPNYSSSAGRAYIFYNDGSYPGTAASADVIIEGETSSYLGYSALVAGDFNADGRTDLAVGGHNYSSSAGRAYIFYNDGSIPTTAGSADVILDGESSSQFGYAIAAGDFNADGRIDLVVGGRGYSSNTGRVYMYTSNDSVSTGESSSAFGRSLAAGDFNADGRTDLAVSANSYSSSTGRTYIFYNDGNISATASSADVIITGESGSQFGFNLTSGDFNADGRTDLAVSAIGYSTNTGRAYIFYNDGNIPTTAATADVIITGEAVVSQLGSALTAGDFNADGKTDLAVGANSYSSSTGRAYIFYNDGSYPSAAGSADVIITGETTSTDFGIGFSAGDFNADGRTDLAVGASFYSSSTGRAYIFYNDGTYPSNATSADVIITGEASTSLGRSLAAGDFNFDGRVDLAIGGQRYSSFTGRTYIFYNDGSYSSTAASADVIIEGENTGDYFGSIVTAGDFNADGKTDLAIGAYQYSSSAGRAYIFYNDGSISTTAGGADKIITGEASSSNFGFALAPGDFNTDGKIDLAVGAYGYSSGTGRTYIILSEVNSASPATEGTVRLKGSGFLRGSGTLE